MAGTRTWKGPRTTLTINGGLVSQLHAFDGLEMTADIVENALGAAGATKKHVSNVGWTPAQARLGLRMGKQMADWLRNSIATPGLMASGSIVSADFNYKAQSTIAFANAMLTRIAFPALDGSSKDSGTLLVGFTAGQVRLGAGDGGDVRAEKSPRAKVWISSNYKVEIGTLPCARVARIEPFTWSIATADGPAGIFRDPPGQAVKATTPDLHLSISAADHSAWIAAARSRFLDGRHLEGDEMPGRITLLGADMKTEIAVISFTNMGFRHFQPMLTGTDEKVARFNVTLYAEAMSLEWKS